MIRLLKNIGIGIGVAILCLIALGLVLLVGYLALQFLSWMVIGLIIFGPFYLVGWLIYKGCKRLARPVEHHHYYHNQTPTVFTTPPEDKGE